MKLFASILLTLSLAAAAVAQQTYTAYSVTDLALDAHKTADLYTATVSVSSNKTSKAPIFSNGTLITISTSGCSHVPVVGETAIVNNGPTGRSLIFSGGASCVITNIAGGKKL